MNCYARRRFLAVALSASVAFLVLAPPAIGANGKLPIPDAAARQAAKKRVEGLYQEKLDAAKTPAKKAALAREMIDVARKTTQDTDGRFALFEYAVILAAGAGDFDAAEAAVDETAMYYDTDALRAKAALLQRAAGATETAGDSVAMRLRLASLAVNLYEHAVENEDVDAAEKLLLAARTAVDTGRKETDARVVEAQAEAEAAQTETAQEVAAAKTASAKAVAKSRAMKAVKTAAAAKQQADEVRAAAGNIDRLAKRLEAWKTLFGPTQEALAILKASPTHADSNLKVGRYRCFVQGEGGATYGYTGPGNGDATTAIGLLCRMYLGWKKDNPALQRGVEILGNRGPSEGNLYYNYYATQVMRHYGGEEWKKWNAVMRDQLVNSQAQKGHEEGSWFMGKGGDHGAHSGGRLYCTALSALILEVYYHYRHMPIYQEQADN